MHLIKAHVTSLFIKQICVTHKLFIHTPVSSPLNGFSASGLAFLSRIKVWMKVSDLP